MGICDQLHSLHSWLLVLLWGIGACRWQAWEKMALVVGAAKSGRSAEENFGRSRLFPFGLSGLLGSSYCLEVESGTRALCGAAHRLDLDKIMGLCYW